MKAQQQEKSEEAQARGQQEQVDIIRVNSADSAH